MTYNYNKVGDINAITDAFFTGTRTFTYDDLNRLSSASGPFGTNQQQTSCTYSYNAIGNITDKCGIVFSYTDPNHPSAVTNQNGKNYTYDANGNMITGAGKTFSWDVENRLDSITVSGSTTSFDYDYTGTRVIKNAPGAITTYPFQGD